MKQRLGFVSNSSSCSFVIHKSHLTSEQMDILREYKIRDFGSEENYESLNESKNYFYGEGEALNYDFNFYEILETLGLKEDIDYVKFDC